MLLFEKIISQTMDSTASPGMKFHRDTDRIIPMRAEGISCMFIKFMVVDRKEDNLANFQKIYIGSLFRESVGHSNAFLKVPMTVVGYSALFQLRPKVASI